MALASAMAVVALIGCGEGASKPAAQGEGSATATAGAEHGGWWCNEHGIPEDQCALCNAQVASDLKSKGDWCAEHGRPDSQCFVCHPENAQKFAALYEAKYGKAPPPREE
jgi:cobalt-zinc-cadmium efflux system membrane fusion protein